MGGFLKAVDDPPSCKLPVPRKTSPTISAVGAVNKIRPPTENNGHDRIETEDDIQNVTPEELEELPDSTSKSSKKNVSEATGANKGTKRYCKWSIKNTNLVKEFFKETIQDCTSKGSKGSLPEKTSILAFLEKHSIFKEREMSKFSLKEQISLVKTKIFK